MAEVTPTNPYAVGNLDVDVLVTTLVLGEPQVAGIMPGQRVMPPQEVGGMLFKYPKMHGEHLLEYETERPLRAPIPLIDWKASTETGELVRRSLGVLKDLAEINQQDQLLPIARRSAWLARRAVEQSIELKRRDLLEDPANYDAGNVTAIAGGSEWDSAGGDCKGDIGPIADNIASHAGVMREDVSMVLSKSSWDAAKACPTWEAVRSGVETSAPTPADLAAYVGLKEVTVSQPKTITTGDAKDDPVEMYSDVAILYYDGGMDLQVIDDRDLEGRRVFAVTFGTNLGYALTSYMDNSRTSQVFPWERAAQPTILDGRLGGLITNTAA